MTRFGDLRGERIEGVDVSGSRWRNVNLSGAKMVDVLLTNADLSGLIDGLKVNGIEVAPLIEAEVERRYPERRKLFGTTPEALRDALPVVEELLGRTWKRASGRGSERLHERVDEEWSVTETVRHLVFVVDAWFRRMILGLDDAFHPIGLPPDFLQSSPPGTDIDASASPSFEEALEVWRGRWAAVRTFVEEMTRDEMKRACEAHGDGYPPTRTTRTVRDCLWSVFGEVWAHDRFMNRDLDALSS